MVVAVDMEASEEVAGDVYLHAREARQAQGRSKERKCIRMVWLLPVYCPATFWSCQQNFIYLNNGQVEN